MNHMTAAQTAQQQNRDGGGRYATKKVDETVLTSDLVTQPDPIDEYTDAREEILKITAHEIGRLRQQSRPDEFADACRSLANDFIEDAIDEASRSSVDDVPPYGHTVLNAHSGAIHSYAEGAAEARSHAEDGLSYLEKEAIADSIAYRVYDTRDFGDSMRARIVRRGAPIGVSGARVAQEDEVVFFDKSLPSQSMTWSGDNSEVNGRPIESFNLDDFVSGNGEYPDELRAWAKKRQR